MDGREPQFNPRLATSASGGCPFIEFLQSETDPKIRAMILTKVEYLSRLQAEDHVRPLVDTLDGAIKELRFGPKKSLRLLYSLEQDTSQILLYGGERKQVRACSPGLIADAKELRDRSKKGAVTRKLDMTKLRKTITRKRMKWP